MKTAVRKRYFMEKEMFESYVSQIQKYPLLTADEEQELAKKIEAGDKAACTRLVNCNLRLVVSIAHRFNTTKVCVMDLVQEGNIGLMTAAAKFQSSFKTRFSTYAYSWIMQYMLRYINNRCAMITLPHRKDEMIRRVEAAQAYLFQQTGHEATSAELALYLGVPEEQMRRVMVYSYSISSLDTDCSDGSMMTVGDLLADTTFSPETILMTEEKKRIIRLLMTNLPENEQKVIWYRFNFDNEVHTKTLREISDLLGVSAETVRQTELRALRHMRAAMEQDEEALTA